MNNKTQVTLGAILVAVILFLAGALPGRAKFMVTALLSALAVGSYVIENEIAKNRQAR